MNMSEGLKYQDIMKEIKVMISEGKLKQGKRLPSIRQMAKRHNCSHGTIIRAYQALEEEHILYTIPKSGYYLIENPKTGDFKPGSPVDFRPATPEGSLLPYQSFEHCIGKAIQLYKSELFLYGSSSGLESLRKELTEHFVKRQVYTKPENIFITCGAQQGLYLLSHMKFPKGGQRIIIEQPTYGVYQRMLENEGLECTGVRRSVNGIDFDALEKEFKKGDIKFFYVIPNYHNPLGTNLTSKDKEKILKLAQRYDVYIIEDDYLGDLNLDPKNYPIHYYDTEGRIIYLTSFSKSFMPGIRIGAVVLPEAFHEDFTSQKKSCDLNTSILAQGGLELFIASGMYQHHIKKVRRAYKEKMLLIDSFNTILSSLGVRVLIPDTGIFIWVQLPDWCTASKLAYRLAEKGVYISEGKQFFINEQNIENSFRLCVAGLTREQIEYGMIQIINEIKAHQKRLKYPYGHIKY